MFKDRNRTSTVGKVLDKMANKTDETSVGMYQLKPYTNFRQPENDKLNTEGELLKSSFGVSTPRSIEGIAKASVYDNTMSAFAISVRNLKRIRTEDEYDPQTDTYKGVPVELLLPAMHKSPFFYKTADLSDPKNYNMKYANAAFDYMEDNINMSEGLKEADAYRKQTTPMATQNYRGLSVDGDNFSYDPTAYGLPESETGGELKKINNSPFAEADQQSAIQQPQFFYEEGGLIGGDYGELPEHSFGSWLGDNAGKILKTAGGIVTAIPPIGPVLGPILIGAGYATDAIVGAVRNKREAEQQQIALDEKTSEQQSQQRLESRGQRQSNLVDQTINYGATFEDGGSLGQGLMEGNPQMIEYKNGGKHDESATRGIPVDARGNPSTTSNQSAVGLTEEGEITWNGYVFSAKAKEKL